MYFLFEGTEYFFMAWLGPMLIEGLGQGIREGFKKLNSICTTLDLVIQIVNRDGC